MRGFCVSGHCEAVVNAAGSASEAIEAFRRDPPDVLVSDIDMPAEDGYSLIQRVLGSGAGGRVPAMALTAYARAEDRVRAIRGRATRCTSLSRSSLRS